MISVSMCTDLPPVSEVTSKSRKDKHLNPDVLVKLKSDLEKLMFDTSSEGIVISSDSTRFTIVMSTFGNFEKEQV